MRLKAEGAHRSLAETVSEDGISRRALFDRVMRLAGGAAASLIFPSVVRTADAEKDHAADASMLWVTTTQTSPWQMKPIRPRGFVWNTLDVDIDLAASAQSIRGFGGCFNELGWTSLQALSEEDRTSIFRELFAPGVGANFSICRMPVGANDFSRSWYSYDESPGDFALEHFSIAQDLETLVPFIKNAQKYNPSLNLWASPWSPPSWMKRNKHYAEALSSPNLPSNGLKPDQVAREGMDMFIQEERYFKTYATYFGRFIDAYKQQGIDVGMVMPQNEFNSAQAFPSCTWTAEGLARFIRYLGPEMAARHVRLFFGTLERGNERLLEVVMNDPEARKYIEGVGVQWAGKHAVAAIHKRYPELQIYQSEQECGDGKNDWQYCGYCWDLMKHYFKSGANAYMYWNISLATGGVSHWGWPQNSLITVDEEAKRYKFNPEYYLMKHVSHFVQPGARRLVTEGSLDNVLAFLNPDKSVVVVLRNESNYERAVNVNVGEKTITASMETDSFNTLLLKP